MKTKTLLAISAFAFHIAAALAQSYNLGSSAISSAGGSSTGGVYSVSGTFGQAHAANVASSGAYSTVSGFGALYVLQTTNAPLLSISRTTLNTVLISWPSASTDWVLRQTTNATTGTWVAPAETVSDDGAVKFIVVSPPTGNRYYRLVKP